MVSKSYILFIIALGIFITSCSKRDIFTSVENKNIQNIERTLKSNPALVSIKNEQNWSPLQLALELQQEGSSNQQSWKPVIETLIKHDADVNTKTEWDYSTLMYACNYGYYDLADYLIKNGADIETQTKKRQDKYLIDYPPGMNPLMYATYGESLKIVKLLLDKGATVNSYDDSKLTPIFHALENNNEEIFHELIKWGADLNWKNRENQSLLIFASANNLTSIINYLIDFNPNLVNEQCNGDFTPIMFAVEYKNTDSVKILLEHGADIDLMDINGNTAYSRAVEYGYQEIIDLIEKHMSR